MKRSLIQILLLVVIHVTTWIAGLLIGMAVFSPDLPAETQDTGFDLWMLTVSFLHVMVLYAYVKYAQADRLWFRLVLISFGLTYLITQVESLWFIGAVGMTRDMLYALVTGGLISSMLFAWAILRILRKPLNQHTETDSMPDFQWFRITTLAVLAILIWPAIYFLAGYYIAWQSGAVREYYSGSGEMKSFLEMMVINFRDHLYTFQVFRSFIWIALAYVIVAPLKGRSLWTSIILTGSLFAVLGSSQLLLENPMMPETVRYVHLIETAVSTFIWGGILGGFMGSSSGQLAVQREQDQAGFVSG